MRIWLSIILFLLTACSAAPLDREMDSNSEQGRLINATVSKIIDGDTIEVVMRGRKETIRFLLVDTPEMFDKRWKGPQPYAEEAKNFVYNKLYGQTVQIEKGIAERDKYGRLLAYVWLDGKTVQEMILERGLARVAYVFEPNIKYVDSYRAIQKSARAKKTGIWSLED